MPRKGRKMKPIRKQVIYVKTELIHQLVEQLLYGLGNLGDYDIVTRMNLSKLDTETTRVELESQEGLEVESFTYNGNKTKL